MDHQDWPDWSGDEPNLGDADTADLNPVDDGLSGLADFGGHGDSDDAGFDDGYGQSDHDLSLDYGPDDGGADLGPGTGHDHGHGGLYPDDDPFDPSAYADGDPADPGHAEPGHAESAHEAGFSVDHEADSTTDADVPDPGGDVTADHLVGTDPDADPHADHAGWDDHQFPPPLDLHEVPEPVDGYPWSDPGTLGTGQADDGSHLQAGWSTPSHNDLFDYAGLEVPSEGDPWQALLGSDDPATGALARWWAPGG